MATPSSAGALLSAHPLYDRMKESSQNRIISLTKVLFLSGVVGVIITKLAKEIIGISGQELSRILPWSFLIYGCAIAFFLSLLILLPFSVYILSHRSETKNGIPMPWYGPFGMLVGITDGKWIVPRYISTPLVLTMSLLGGLMTYVLAMAFTFGYLLK